MGHLETFSRVGLRCLLVATKVLSEGEYEVFDKKYNALADCSRREEEMSKLVDELEQDLFLIGATAVEDKLSQNVPETIADLLKASNLLLFSQL